VAHDLLINFTNPARANRIADSSCLRVCVKLSAGYRLVIAFSPATAKLGKSEGWNRPLISMLSREIAMTTQSVSSRSSFPGIQRVPPWRRIVETVRTWQSRIESRRELAVLHESIIKDIGYPAEAEAEKSKPFWRA